MARPQVNQDEIAQWGQYRIPLAQQRGTPTAATRAVMNQNPGSELVDVVVDRRDRSGRIYANDIQYYVLLRSGWRASQSSGGGGGGATGPGAVAANALVKQFTGGGDGAQIGVGDTQGVASPAQGQFTGLSLGIPETKIPPGKSPDAENVDGVTFGGALTPRFGLIQSAPRRYDSLVGAGPAIGTAYFGRSVNMLSQAFWQSGVPTGVFTYDKSSIGAAAVASATRTVSKQVRPAWNVQADIGPIAPTVTHLTNAAGVVQFVVSLPAKYRKNVSQGIVASVDQLVVRRSTIAFPRDRDGKEYASNAASTVVGIASIALKNYTAWDGTSVTVSESGLTAGTTRYYTAFGLNKLGESQPAYYKVTVA